MSNESTRVSIMELDTNGRKHCRFICDDGMYCGVEQIAGRSSYCAEHHKIVWVEVRVPRRSPVSIPVDVIEPKPAQISEVL